MIDKVQAEAPNLRELEHQKLGDAYVHQERRKQLEEKTILQVQERERQTSAYLHLESAHIRECRVEEAKESQRRIEEPAVKQALIARKHLDKVARLKAIG